MMLRRHFFPEELQADLSDMEGFQYPPEVEQLPQPTADNVRAVMCRQLPFSAPGIDSIPNSFLRALRDSFVEAMASLTQACWQSVHHPTYFRKARTVALHKPEKGDY